MFDSNYCLVSREKMKSEISIHSDSAQRPYRHHNKEKSRQTERQSYGTVKPCVVPSNTQHIGNKQGLSQSCREIGEGKTVKERFCSGVHRFTAPKSDYNDCVTNKGC